MQHLKDSDCDVNPDTLCCDQCGVDHSGECLECGGRGFHKPDCPTMILDTPNKNLMPFQSDIVRWVLRKGRVTLIDPYMEAVSLIPDQGEILDMTSLASGDESSVEEFISQISGDNEAKAAAVSEKFGVSLSAALEDVEEYVRN